MSSGRSAKRARQKERRDARREAMREVMRRRRRQRGLVLVLSALVLVGVGVTLVLVAFRDPSDPEPEPTPDDMALEVTAPAPQPVACDADLPDAAGSTKQMHAAPEDQGLEGNYLLRLETSCGRIDIALDVEDSPRTVNSVAFLAEQGFYDGLVFHRIVPGFVAQGGDPQGDGSGGPGYDVVEPPPDDTTYTRGVVAMAKGADDPPGSSGSQFFIVSGEDAALPPEYAVLGELVSGEDVLDEIMGFGPGGEQAPTAWVYIERARVIEEDAA